MVVYRLEMTDGTVRYIDDAACDPYVCADGIVVITHRSPIPPATSQIDITEEVHGVRYIFRGTAVPKESKGEAS